MSIDVKRLYNLLPAVYRLRDAEKGDEPLRALLAVIAEQIEVLEGDLEQLYNDQFIETCADWVIPYIGDLLGVRGVHTIDSAGIYSLRANVANTIRYRRRKGTATVLEQLARDVTNWSARAVEFFQLLAATQHLNHLRPKNLRTPHLRNTAKLELLDTPFDTIAHTGEIRRIASKRGKYNIPNVGIFLWRLRPYFVKMGQALSISDGCFTFNPLGIDIPLFNRPITETEISHLAEQINVPGRLRRWQLFEELEDYRQSIVVGRSPSILYFNNQSVFEVFIDDPGSNDELVAIPNEEILICDLSEWLRPPTNKTYQKRTISADGSQVIEDIQMPISVSVDPVSSDVGGGPYNRQDSIQSALSREITWQIAVSQLIDPVAGEIVENISEAVDAWNNQPAGTVGAILIMDNCSYEENLTGTNKIRIPENSQLMLVAADWPEEEIPDSQGQTERRIGRLQSNDQHPHIKGDISVVGTAPANSQEAGELILNGLLIEGDLRVLVGNLGNLQVNHCTIAPGSGEFVVNSSEQSNQQNTSLQVSLDRSILEAVNLPGSIPELNIKDSILSCPEGYAISAPGASTAINTSTILGQSEVRILYTSESIFTEIVSAELRQTGCVRFCYLPFDSIVPRRYLCQPDLALEVEANRLGYKSVAELHLNEFEGVLARLRPDFTSVRYGDPGYAQLSQNCAEEILTGAEDGSEMGVFCHLKQPQRVTNLRIALDEYLRFGLEAGIFFAT
jgi:hypothetical protein